VVSWIVARFTGFKPRAKLNISRLSVVNSQFLAVLLPTDSCLLPPDYDWKRNTRLIPGILRAARAYARALVALVAG
jgi:hypothetical protein